MQTVLVPTDFNVASLNCIPALCKKFKGDDITFIFVHMFKLSDSITDLLMLSKRSREYELVSDEFYRRCNEIKAQNPAIKLIKIEFLYGSTLSMFKNFIEAYDVNYLADVSDCAIGKIHKSSIDPSVLLKKCGLPVITADTYTVIEETVTAKPRQELEMNEV